MRSSSPFLTVLLALLAAPAGGRPVPPEIQSGIEATLRSKVDSLLSEKDQEGFSFKRGSYSKLLDQIDDSTWHATFHVEFADKDTLTTQRVLITLTADGPSGKWTISDERVQDTRRLLTRSVPGDEDFQAFDALSLEREGLRVTASGGTLYRDFRKAQVERFVVTAADLAYDYIPPIEPDRQLYEMFKSDHRPDVIFEPEQLTVLCDAGSCEQILATGFKGLRPIPFDQAGELLRGAYEEFSKDEQRQRREDPFSGFRRPDEPDRRRAWLIIKKKGSEHRVVLRSDNREPEEVAFLVSDYGALFSYNTEQTRNSGVPPVALERRPDPESRDIDVTSVKGTVEMGFGDGELLTGDVVFEMKARRALREIPFEIAQFSAEKQSGREARRPRMHINALRDGSGTELTWVRTGATSGLVVLPEALAQDDTFTIAIQFENTDCIHKATPHYFYVARSGWLPFLHHGDMIQEFDLTVKVPARFEVLGVGTKVAEERKDGISATRWVSHEPVHFPTVIFGGYHEALARVKAARDDGTPIRVAAHVDRDSSDTISPSSLQGLADQAAQCLDLYQRLFGVQYPYGKLDLVNDTGSALSAQAPSSMVFLGSRFVASRGVGQMTKAEIERSSRALVPHEVAHQWWGSMVGAAGERHTWFEEALAEYTSSLYLQAGSGRKGYLERVEDWRREAIQTEMFASVQDARHEWSGGTDGYHALIYAKGPYVFHMMRSIWGDERFFSFLERLARDFKGREIVTRDLQRIAEKTFEEPLEWFFDQWVRGVGIPEFTFVYAARQAEDGSYRIEGRVEQRVLLSAKLKPRKVLEGRFFKCSVFVTATGKGGKQYQQLVEIGDRSTPFTMIVPEKPREIRLNQSGETLAHEVIVSEGT